MQKYITLSFAIIRTVTHKVDCINKQETMKLAYVTNIRNSVIMSDKAPIKVHFLPFVTILLLKFLCMKLCLIITSVTIPIMFKCLLLLHFISYREQHSKQLSQYSYQSRQNLDL